VERATFDAMRLAPDIRTAAVASDMVFAAELTSINRMRRFARQHPGRPGVIQVGAALALADEHSRSPTESLMRLVWQLDAGFPHPLCNRAIYTRTGRLIGVPDLLDEEAGVAGEYDGGFHQKRNRRRRDAAREQAFRAVGLETFKVVAGDLGAGSLVPQRMTAARSRARWLPPEQRSWTLVNPHDESPEETLDFRLDRRDLADEHQRRLDDRS